MAIAKKTRSIGLSALMFGAVQSSGGMPEDMVQIARTLKGTANFTTEQDQTQDFYSEEYPDASEESVVSEKGLKNLVTSFMEWDNDVLKKARLDARDYQLAADAAQIGRAHV